MALSRKHYAAVAAVIADVRSFGWVAENEQASTGVDAVDKIAYGLASLFARNSPSFDADYFLQDCKAE